MNREQVMKDAESVGLIVQACHSEDNIAVRAGEAPNPNERMRMTSDGSLMIVDDGYYWQVGTVEDVANYVKTLKESKQ